MSDWLNVVVEVGLHTLDVFIHPGDDGRSRPWLLGCLSVSCILGIGILLFIWLR
jgi:hypothetical protein